MEMGLQEHRKFEKPRALSVAISDEGRVLIFKTSKAITLGEDVAGGSSFLLHIFLYFKIKKTINNVKINMQSLLAKHKFYEKKSNFLKK